MKSTEQLENEFWNLKLENEKRNTQIQTEILEIEKRFNAKLFNVTAGAIALISVLGVIIGLVKAF